MHNNKDLISYVTWVYTILIVTFLFWLLFDLQVFSLWKQRMFVDLQGFTRDLREVTQKYKMSNLILQ